MNYDIFFQNYEFSRNSHQLSILRKIDKITTKSTTYFVEFELVNTKIGIHKYTIKDHLRGCF